MISFRSSITGDKQALVIFLETDQVKAKRLPDFPKAVKAAVLAVLAAGHFTGETGELFPVSGEKGLVLLAGLGAHKDLTATQLRILARSAFLSSYLKKLKTVEVVPPSRPREM